mmetsp:Transcript_19801/g.46048  ORF Transcript_19801/g.46048 Transcript_19801/m.46048 type:complete len:266 (+) Transcript_19801:263-1060(+)
MGKCFDLFTFITAKVHAAQEEDKLAFAVLGLRTIRVDICIGVWTALRPLLVCHIAEHRREGVQNLHHLGQSCGIAAAEPTLHQRCCLGSHLQRFRNICLGLDAHLLNICIPAWTGRRSTRGGGSRSRRWGARQGGVHSAAPTSRAHRWKPITISNPLAVHPNTAPCGVHLCEAHSLFQFSCRSRAVVLKTNISHICANFDSKLRIDAEPIGNPDKELRWCGIIQAQISPIEDVIGFWALRRVIGRMARVEVMGVGVKVDLGELTW